MPFNSKSYYRNKAKRQAQQYLAAAREAKSRQDPRSVSFNVRMARSSWTTYLSHLELARCDADLKRFQRGEITYQEFMDKWDVRKGAK